MIPGADHLVEIQPVFSWGDGVYGPGECLRIAGSAQMALEGGEDFLTPDVKTFMSEAQQNWEMVVSPNPTRGDQLNLAISGDESESVRINVRDAVGKVVFTQSYAIESSARLTIAFETSLAPGVYLVELRTSDGSLTKQLIVKD